MHEASLHDANSFIRLSYRDEELPEGKSLDKLAVPKFMRRLRRSREVRRVNPETGKLKWYSGPPVKYFYCGEYGTEHERPHYHVIVFGYDPEDKVRFGRSKGFPLWRSDEVERLWPMGHSTIGSVTFESAAYVARYMVDPLAKLKYVKGSRQDFLRAQKEHYGDRIPEFSQMSRRGGIGKGWLDRFGEEVYPADAVITRGRETRPPRYYDLQMALREADLINSVRESRRRVRMERPLETQRTLATAEVVEEARVNLYRRSEL